MPLSLKLSSHFEKIGLGPGRFVVYHSLLGRPLSVNGDTLRLLESYRSKNRRREISRKYSIPGAKRWEMYFRRKGFLVPEGVDERLAVSSLPGRMRRLLKRDPVVRGIGFTTGTACNFSCGYCISHRLAETSRRPSRFRERMRYPLAMRIVRTYCRQILKSGLKSGSIGFSGGEPLLHWGVVRRIIATADKEFGRSLKLEFNLNTNASLITGPIATFFARFLVRPSLSLDGYDRRTNNAVRTFATGRGSTFDLIVEKIGLLRKKGVAVEGFYITLTRGNADLDPGRLVNFLIDNGFSGATIEPDLLGLDMPVDVVVDKLMAFEERFRRRGLHLHGFWKWPFMNLVDPKRFPSDATFCPSLRGEMLAVDNLGVLRVCAYSDEPLGTFEELPGIRASTRFGEMLEKHLKGNIVFCSGCEIEGFCLGGCYATREFSARCGNLRVAETRCGLYKTATRRLFQLGVPPAPPEKVSGLQFAH